MKEHTRCIAAPADEGMFKPQPQNRIRSELYWTEADTPDWTAVTLSDGSRTVANVNKHAGSYQVEYIVPARQSDQDGATHFVAVEGVYITRPGGAHTLLSDAVSEIESACNMPPPEGYESSQCAHVLDEHKHELIPPDGWEQRFRRMFWDTDRGGGTFLTLWEPWGRREPDSAFHLGLSPLGAQIARVWFNWEYYYVKYYAHVSGGLQNVGGGFPHRFLSQAVRASEQGAELGACLTRLTRRQPQSG